MEFIDLKAQYRAHRSALDARIHAVLEHGQYIMGPEVAELEARLASYTGSRHCITVSSGTEALLISLMALEVGPGDEVITSAFSFVSVAEVIALLGATPVFVDIEPETCNIDAEQIEEKITYRTRAIVPVSLYGQPADMERINAIGDAYDIPVIEDAAQSFGASYRGRRSGNLSTIGCTSFFPSKPLGCYGDGGAIFTNDDGLARIMREIRVHGQERRYLHSRIGVGGRMDTLQCAIVLAKLDSFPWEVEQRMKLGAHYNALFDGRIDTVLQRPDRTSVFAQYTVRLRHRDSAQAFLKERGIPTAIHYPGPIPLQPGYARYRSTADFPVAMEMAQKVLSLPMGPYLAVEQATQVADTLLRFVDR